MAYIDFRKPSLIIKRGRKKADGNEELDIIREEAYQIQQLLIKGTYQCAVITREMIVLVPFRKSNS